MSIIEPMAGPSVSGPPSIRQPAVAGRFYPADPTECRALAKGYTSAGATGVSNDQTTRWTGGVVPHAGWICSGAIAGQTIGSIAARNATPDVVVVFGAIHTPIPTNVAAMDSFGRWDVPGEACDVQRDLRARMIAGSADLFYVDDRFHLREHAVEVELPLIRSVWPNAAILPIEIPPTENAAEIGRRTARVVQQANLNAVYLASSDFTHYGLNYGFTPAGVGLGAMQWAKHNDRALLDLILQLREQAIVPEVRAHANACGAGAIAAMIAACKELGASKAKLLRHATSFETLAPVAPQRPDNAVGYASIIVG